MAYKRFEELAIYQAIEDLAVWLVPHIGRWAKWLRPSLVDCTMECLMNIMRAATRAYSADSPRKQMYLRRASAELDGLRMTLKLSVALRQTSHRQFAHVSRLMGNVGRQLGGWLKAVEQRGKGEK